MSTIKPSQIFQVLDAAKRIKAAGGKYVPCFSGDSGIGKSEIHQAWAKQQGSDFKFIDIRLAYMEGPDMVGMPSAIKVNGKLTTVHALPEFLPTEGEGLLMFEEPNRAHESVMQTMMQILTDYKIHTYDLPKGWIISTAINPEGQYNVNTLDPAMKNRLAIFDVKFNQNEFIQYAKDAGFNTQLVSFLESGLWQYKAVDQIGTDGIYIASRSWSKVNDLMTVITPSGPMFFEMLVSVLGTVATDFFKFINEIRPVLFEDFQANEEEAIKRLKKITSSPNYTGDLTSSTISSLVDAYGRKDCGDALILKVATLIEQDQALNLVQQTVCNVTPELLKESMKENKTFWEHYKRRVKGKKAA